MWSQRRESVSISCSILVEIGIAHLLLRPTQVSTPPQNVITPTMLVYCIFTSNFYDDKFPHAVDSNICLIIKWGKSNKIILKNSDTPGSADIEDGKTQVTA